MLCAKCKQEIPVARLKILPDTKTCVKCSNIKPYRAAVHVSPKHKVVEVEPVSADDPMFDYLDEDRRSNE